MDLKKGQETESQPRVFKNTLLRQYKYVCLCRRSVNDSYVSVLIPYYGDCKMYGNNNEGRSDREWVEDIADQCKTSY